MKMFLVFFTGLMLLATPLLKAGTTTAIDTNGTVNVPVKLNITTVLKADSVSAKSATQMCNERLMHCFNCDEKLDFCEWLIVFLPVIMFLIFIISLKAILNKNGFKLSDSLTENIPVQVTKPNPDPATAATNPIVTVNELPKSASRLILFMSGFMAITISVCLTTYYLYVFLHTGCAPDLDNLTNVLLSFGIGVIPYAFNKVSTALKMN